MFLFEIEMVGGPCDGWRCDVASTPGRMLRVRCGAGACELLPSGAPSGAVSSPLADVAEYHFREVVQLAPQGPRVALRYDFLRYAPRAPRPARYNCRGGGSSPARSAAPAGLWRRLLAGLRAWMLAPVDVPGCVRALK